MYDQTKAQYPGSAINQALPAPSRQVEGQLDNLTYSLDALQDIANELIHRLEPVTGGCPESDQSADSLKSTALVPIAARVSFADSRVRYITERLKHALNALEI